MGNVSLRLRTLFLQEMMKEKILFPYVALSFSHNENEMKRTLLAIDKSFGLIKKAIDGQIDDYLTSEVIKPVFRNIIKMIDNQIIFIVGGLGLLGKAFSKCVVENGAKLIIGELDTKENFKQFNDLKQKLNSNKIEFIPFDISSESSIKKGFEILFESHPLIDAVVNTSYPRNKNFGNDLLEVNIEDFNENINLHLGGYFFNLSNCHKTFFETREWKSY